MVDIMSHYQKYCPVVERKMQSILLGGDGLTCERAHDAWLARSDGDTQEVRLDGLVIKAEDWHKNAIICRQVMLHLYIFKTCFNNKMIDIFYTISIILYLLIISKILLSNHFRLCLTYTIQSCPVVIMVLSTK